MGEPLYLAVITEEIDLILIFFSCPGDARVRFGHTAAKVRAPRCTATSTEGTETSGSQKSGVS